MSKIALERGFGHRPLPPDDRDYDGGAYLLEHRSLRDIVRRRRWWKRPLMLDQGATGTCVANAQVHMLADWPVVHPDLAWLADPIAAEVMARKLYVEGTGDESLQNGANTRDVLDVLLKHGYIGSYLRLKSTVEVVQAVLTQGPVVFASPWYSSMDHVEDWADNPQWLEVDEGSGIRGYHEYVLDAVDLRPRDGSEPFVRLHNSWGEGWAHGGTARVAVSNLPKLYIGDAWIVTEVGVLGS